MAAPGIRAELEPMRIESVNVVGRGRVGSAVAARLEERGVALREDDADIVLLCVPDSAIAATAECQTLVMSQWVGHTSGATPLTAIPHARRFGRVVEEARCASLPRGGETGARCIGSPKVVRLSAREVGGGGQAAADRPPPCVSSR